MMPRPAHLAFVPARQRAALTHRVRPAARPIPSSSPPPSPSVATFRARTLATSASASSPLVASTRRWFDTVVIGPDRLCPFAPPLARDGGSPLRVVSSDAATAEDAIADVRSEADLLVGEGRIAAAAAAAGGGDDEGDVTSRHETTLVVFDETALSEVRDFRDFVRLSWEMQLRAVSEPGLADLVQIVLFHPSAVHDTYAEKPPRPSGGGGLGDRDREEDADAADFTIRSPHPTIHLLREVDVLKAVSGGYKDLEGLPARNKAKLRRTGVEECRRRLQWCRYGKD